MCFIFVHVGLRSVLVLLEKAYMGKDGVSLNSYPFFPSFLLRTGVFHKGVNITFNKCSVSSYQHSCLRSFRLDEVSHGEPFFKAFNRGQSPSFCLPIRYFFSSAFDRSANFLRTSRRFPFTGAIGI